MFLRLFYFTLLWKLHQNRSDFFEYVAQEHSPSSDPKERPGFLSNLVKGLFFDKETEYIAM